MRYPVASLLFILSTSIGLSNEPSALQPIEIAAYDLSGNDSLMITSVTGDSLKLPTYSGVLSNWHTAVPPIKIASGDDYEEVTTWSPEAEATSRKWILITYKDVETDAPRVEAFPAKSLMRSESSLFLINLTSLELEGRSRGSEVRLKPHGQTFLENPKSNVSVTLKASESPHYSQVSLSDLDSDQSFMLLFSYPHIRGSALLSHRLVRFPNLK